MQTQTALPESKTDQILFPHPPIKITPTPECPVKILSWNIAGPDAKRDGAAELRVQQALAVIDTQKLNLDLIALQGVPQGKTETGPDGEVVGSGKLLNDWCIQNGWQFGSCKADLVLLFNPKTLHDCEWRRMSQYAVPVIEYKGTIPEDAFQEKIFFLVGQNEWLVVNNIHLKKEDENGVIDLLIAPNNKKYNIKEQRVVRPIVIGDSAGKPVCFEWKQNQMNAHGHEKLDFHRLTEIDTQLDAKTQAYLGKMGITPKLMTNLSGGTFLRLEYKQDNAVAKFFRKEALTVPEIQMGVDFVRMPLAKFQNYSQKVATFISGYQYILDTNKIKAFRSNFVAKAALADKCALEACILIEAEKLGHPTGRTARLWGNADSPGLFQTGSNPVLGVSQKTGQANDHRHEP